MKSLFSTVSITGPGAVLGQRGILPRGEANADFLHGDRGPSFDLRLRRARLGLLVGLTGILMVFVSFTSAYLVRQGLPTFDPRTNTMVRDWLPVRLPGILLANTAVLLLSSLTMERARRAVLAQVRLAGQVSLARETAVSWLGPTVLLGLGFLGGQWLAWRQLMASGFDVAASPSSSFVYVLTGMHGLHLAGGVLALLAAAAATLLGKPLESRAVLLDVSGWYWHAMAALWVYILCLVEFAG